MFHAWAVKMAKMVAHSTPSRLPGNSAQETGHGDRQETEHGHRLQDVEQRQQHALGAPAARRRVTVGEGEQERCASDEHAQHRARRIIRQSSILRLIAVSACAGSERNQRPPRRGARSPASSASVPRKTATSARPAAPLGGPSALGKRTLGLRRHAAELRRISQWPPARDSGKVKRRFGSPAARSGRTRRRRDRPGSRRQAPSTRSPRW